MLPKADDAAAVREAAWTLGDSPLIALIETAQGALVARQVVQVPAVQRLAFGSFDLAAELASARQIGKRWSWLAMAWCSRRPLPVCPARSTA